MNINEVLGGLQGLGNLGGEMPRVTTPKKIKEIKPGKKNKSIKTRKGPMNIDLSKLGEEKPNHLKAKSKVTKKVKPTTGHESPNINRGKFVGEDDGMYDQVPQGMEYRTTAAKTASKQNVARGSAYHEQMINYMVQQHPKVTFGQFKQNASKFEIAFSNHQNAQKAQKVLNKPAPNMNKYKAGPGSAQGIKDRA